eukprot:944743_1
MRKRSVRTPRAKQCLPAINTHIYGWTALNTSGRSRAPPRNIFGYFSSGSTGNCPVLIWFCRTQVILAGGFPKNFKTSMSQILRRLFRLYAHLYHSHYDKFRDIGADSNLDLNFRHFVFFIREFNLISDNDMMPLKRLIDGFVRDGAKKN